MMLRSVKDLSVKRFSSDLLRIFMEIYGVNRKLISIFFSRFGLNINIGNIFYLIGQNRWFIERLIKLISKDFLVESDLKKLEISIFFSKKNTKWFKYFAMGKPVRGQRTKTNARVAKKKFQFNLYTNLTYSQLLPEVQMKRVILLLEKLFKI